LNIENTNLAEAGHEDQVEVAAVDVVELTFTIRLYVPNSLIIQTGYGLGILCI
jgi:hypothetical protein